MEDILSQEEIDMLIKASMSPGDAEGQEPEPEEDLSTLYDFRKPNKFSKDHIRSLQRIYDQFCRTYSGLMSAKLRSRLDLRVSAIEQLTFGEFVSSLPNPSVLAIMSAQPLEGSAILQLSPDTSSLLHDRLCGGPGRLVNRSRGLTDIEMAVLRKQILTSIADLMSDAWREVSPVEFALEQVETNPQFLQISADRDVVVLISFSFEFNGIQDMVNFSIPYRMLEPIMKHLTHHRLFESLRQPDPEKLRQLKKKVRSVVLPVEVELGATTVTVQDLLDLEVGDAIPLDRARDENLEVKIGSLTKFKGTPGKLGTKLGIVITSVMESESESEGEHQNE